MIINGQFFVCPVCVSRPWLVLLTGLLVFICLACGILFVKVTTDPIELWANPLSRSRVEKEYYDSNFRPFYRTEQIIIHAVGLPNITHNTSLGPVTFGPVFNVSFLKKVYDLEQSIRNVRLQKCTKYRDYGVSSRIA